MAQKDRVVRRIDERNDNLITGGGQLIVGGQQEFVPPTIPDAPEPENVTIGSQTLIRTTLVPKVLVQVSWDNPPNVIPEIYIVQAAKDSGFTIGLLSFTTNTDSAAIELNTDTDYWIRVQAIARNIASSWAYPSNYPTVSVHTDTDTTPPGEVSGVTTDWSTGDLLIRWTNPTSSNFFQTRVRIYNTAGGTLYKEIYVVGNAGSPSYYIFTANENNQVTGNNPLTTVYYDLRAYSIAGIPSPAGVTGTVTKTPPTKPTGLTSTWSGDDGTYDEGVTFSWNAVTGVEDYKLIVDGITKYTKYTQYTYTYTENVSDHRPTLVSGDYALAYTVQARDPLGQLSGGASGTATNIAPQSSNLTLTTVPGFSALAAYITPAKEIKDLYRYRWTLKSGGVTVTTTLSNTPEIIFDTLNGNYTLDVYAIDLFGQKSNTVSQSGIILDGLTIESLRASIDYTNSLGTNPATLDGLKNNDLITSVVTVPSGTTWQWHKGERALLDRYRTFTVALSGAATNMPRVYFGLSADDSTYRWFSGPLSGTYGTTMTEHASESIAQASGILTTNINRFDLPEVLEARFMKMGHRGNTHYLAEYYPRRLVQTDDLEAETIKSINIAAGNILANHISVINLAAVSIYTGSLTISGVLSIHIDGGLYQGTGSFSSPTTGLKIYNTGGIGRLTTYSGGIAQINVDTVGRLTFGGGVGFLDNIGLTITGGSFTYSLSNPTVISTPRSREVRWTASGSSTAPRVLGSNSGQLFAYADRITLASPVSSQDSYGLDINVGTTRMVADTFKIDSGGTTGASALKVTTDLFTGGTTNVYGGLEVGSGNTGATDGQVFTDGQIYISMAGTSKKFLRIDNTSANADTIISLENSGNNITSGSYFIRATKGSTDQFFVRGDGVLFTGGGGIIALDNGTTATADQVLEIRHTSTGTPAAGFGSVLFWNLHSSTNTLRSAADTRVSWAAATDASRKGRVQHVVYDTASREVLRLETNGSAAMIGFLGSAAALKQNITGTRTGTLAQLQTVVANLLTGLANFGLITDSTT